MFSRHLLSAVAGMLLTIAVPITVSAHAALVDADPPPDAVLTVAPAELIARFSQDLRADRTSIEVRDASGATVVRGGKDPAKARVQLVPLPSLAPGTYEVRWVTYSAEDDELARGRYTFTIEPGHSPAPLPSCAPGPSISPIASAPPSSYAVTSPSPSPSVVLPAPTSSNDPCAIAAPGSTPAASPMPSTSPSP